MRSGGGPTPASSAEQAVPGLAQLSAFILERVAPRGATGLDESTSLVESGWLDSFAIVELVAFLEREFRVVLRDEDVVPANFETLGAIRRLLEQATPR
jgi:acyl carrier protein